VFDWNTTSTAYVLGRRSNGNAQYYFDGYMTEVNAIDGAALTPSSFGTFNSYGVWQPITYGGSYGTNGFYLTFGNNTSTTTLGYDTSPNGNNWTTNNISLTTGATYDSMLDVPTLTSATVANYATWNPVGGGAGTLSNANLTSTTSSLTPSLAGMAMQSGKWYWEVTIQTVSNPRIGVYDASTAISTDFGATAGAWCMLNSPSRIINNNSASSYGSFAPVSGTVMILAYDADNGRLWYGQDGTWFASGNPATNANPSQTSVTGKAIVAAVSSGTGSNVFNINFGQQGFAYTPPSGFVALNTYNLSTPTIPNGAVYFAATTYTGTGATQVVTNTVNGTAMQPDFVWLKSRSAARDHRLMDTNRGINNIIYSDLAIVESAGSALSSVNSNGFTLNTTDNQNVSSETYIGWQWKANAGTNVSNTSGSITSTVSANTTAGFSVVTYTGTGANATVGHGLGVTPSMMIFKNRTGVYNWAVYHASLANASTTLELNNATAADGTNGTTFNATAPTSSVFSLGTNDRVNRSTNTFVAYIFAPIAGYSAFGSYTGNGSTDGPFVYTGFRPRFIMVKCSSNSTGSTVWTMWDTSRSPYNASVNELYANLNSVESVDASGIDILSNGFKPKRNSEYANTSGWTYIYMAFAENPFKYSLAR
jgi:hypothetical protein